jgi:long-chain fatty acid transport protein
MNANKTLVAAVLLLPALALANGYSVPNVSARDLGTTGALNAAQRDAGATWANPAALSKLDGLDVQLGIALLDNQTTWKDAGQSSTTKFQPATPPAMWVGYGSQEGPMPMGIGAGMTITAGGNMRWQDDWAGRFRIITVDRKVYAFTAAGGLQILPQLRLGGGPIYYYTTEYLRQQVDYLTTEGPAQISVKGGAFAYSAAAELTPVVGYPFTLSVDYKHQGVQKLEGHAHYAYVPAPLSTSLVDQKATHVLVTPNVLHVSAAWRPAKDWLLGADFTFDRYKVYRDDTFRGEFAASCPSASCVVVKRNYDNGQSYRLGAEYTYSPKLELRGGLMRDVSGLNTDTYSPTIPDGNAWIVAGGATYRVGPTLALSGALYYALFDKVTATGTETFQGSYQTGVLIAGVTVGWRPGATAR